MKFTKKIMSIILALFLMSVSINSVFASEIVEDNSTGYIYEKDILDLTSEEILTYSQYQLKLNNDNTLYSYNENEDFQFNKSSIINLCTLSSTKTVGNHVIKKYTSSGIVDYLNFCDSIPVVTEIDKLLYIEYNDIYNNSVILSYSDNGINEITYYDVENDTFIQITKDNKQKITNYRNGCRYEMSKETEKIINDYAEKGNIYELNGKYNLKVTENNDGSYFIEEINSIPQISMVAGMTDASLIADLKNDFPEYTKVVKHTTTRYSGSLGRTLNIQVKESRNSYTKKSANFTTFAVNTTLSAIGTYLSVPVATVNIILTGLNIAYSAYGYIQEAVTLYKSANIEYSGLSMGYVYDNTVYNDYVKVIEHYGTGEFHGGYNSSGQFAWIEYLSSSAYSKSYSTIADQSANNYSADIVMNGLCMSYRPD